MNSFLPRPAEREIQLDEKEKEAKNRDERQRRESDQRHLRHRLCGLLICRETNMFSC